MENTKGIVIKKRNLIAIIVWCAMFLALVAGITLNAVLYRLGKIEDSDVYRRLWYAALCFVMMSAVYVVEYLFHIRFPLWLELVLSIFAFAALAGGTVFGLYAVFPVFDKILHGLSGTLFSLAGLFLASLLLKETGKRNVVASVIFAFLVALAVGYVWELFEYTVDSVIPGYNNQGWLPSVIEELENGTFLVTDKRGTALHDTMWDMICNFLGAVLLLVPLFFLLFKRPQRLAFFHVERTPRKKKQKIDQQDA